MVRRRVGTSGQMHTIEGISAAMLLVLSLTFAFQSIGLTSTSASTSSAEIEDQYAELASDVLTASKASGALRDGVLNWNTARGAFEGAVTDRSSQSYYAGKTPPGRFGRNLELMLTDNDLAYNVDIVYKEGDDDGRTRFVYNGAPSTSAVTVSTTLVLSETDELGDGTKLRNSNYPVDDLPQAGLYNIVEVELTVWRR